MSDGAGPGIVENAREAATRGEWQQAFDQLMEADADGLLALADLPVLGEIAYAAGHLDVTIEAWERAHAACLLAGDEAADVRCDVTDPDQIDAAVTSTIDRIGVPDTVTITAGVGHSGTLLDTPVSGWDQVFGINTKGVWLAMRALARPMLDTNAGSMSSRPASVPAWPTARWVSTAPRKPLSTCSSQSPPRNGRRTSASTPSHPASPTPRCSDPRRGTATGSTALPTEPLSPASAPPRTSPKPSRPYTE